MYKFSLIKRKFFTILSFSTALFIFQACYGTPQDMKDDVSIRGVILSAETGHPIPGVRVELQNTRQYLFSDEHGEFELYTSPQQQYHLALADEDGSDHGFFSGETRIIDNSMAADFLELKMEPMP